MSLKEIEQRFQGLDEVIHVDAQGDGYRYELIVVSNQFDGQSTVKRQQWVYTQLGDLILSGRLHAISMHTFTQAEWEKQHG